MEIDTYFCNIYSVYKYISEDKNPKQCRKTIINDTLKCMSIGTIFNMIFLYGLGQAHYLKYFKWMTLGCIFGVGYSFHFTSQKVDTFIIRKKMGLK